MLKDAILFWFAKGVGELLFGLLMFAAGIGIYLLLKWWSNRG